MAKKYYWLKLKDDFFNQREIKKLRKIAGGDTFTIIYLRIQLLSLKNEGCITFEKTEQTLEEQIALEIDEDVENVKLTLAFLYQNSLIEQITTDDYLLPKTIATMGSETDVAERVRKHRERNLLPKNDTKTLQCNADVTNCNTEIERIEKRKELENKREEKRANKKEPLNLIPLVEQSELSPPLQEVLKEWLEYKKEKKDTYTDIGFKKALTTIKNNVAQYGEEQVIDLLNLCMSNNWKGIIWDKLKEANKNTKTNKVNFMDINF